MLAIYADIVLTLLMLIGLTGTVVLVVRDEHEHGLRSVTPRGASVRRRPIHTLRPRPTS